MAEGQKIKLFKIASEINIGKDAIIEFLQSKGFDIENKPTASLNDDMLDAIYEKFKKEKIAAEKQREKVEKHKIKKVVPETKQKQLPLEKPVEHREIKVPQDSGSPKEVRIEVLQPEKPIQKTIAVNPGDVIKIEDRGVKVKKDPYEYGLKVVGRIEPALLEKQEDRHSKEASAQRDAQLRIKSKRKPEAHEHTEIDDRKHITVKPNKELTPDKELKPRFIQKPTDVLEDKPVKVISKKEDLPIAPEKAKPETKPEKIEPHIIIKEKPQTEEPKTVQENIPIVDSKPVSEEETAEFKAKKKKKKKRILEIEYDSEEQPKLKGLTIVGKIDLTLGEDRKEKQLKKREFEEEEEAPKGKSKVQKLKKKIKGKGKENQLVKDRIIEKKKKRKKSIRESITEEDISRAIKETWAGIGESSTVSMRSKLRQKKKAEREEKELRKQEEIERESKTLKITEYVTTSDLASLMNVSPNEIIRKCIELGLMVSINQRLDKDTIVVIADDYDYDIEFLDETAIQDIEIEEEADETQLPRPPIVTIMGHVDHGKTSLLDCIRATNVVAGEAGGITQHIGAYRVELGEKSITFLDTPGHEAFTAMRARGAHVTDIVVLVVAADDSVMPQTIEAISHAQAANVPIIVAINKIDKPDSQPDRIRQQLADHRILVEDWGGKYQCVEISAKKRINVELLLEKILLEAEMLELKANPYRKAKGTIVEANMDKGLGAVATVIIQKGTITAHDCFVAGSNPGKVRIMLDERSNRVESAGPSIPVRIIGFNGLPEAGDIMTVVNSEQEAKEIANQRRQRRREQEFRQVRHVTLDDISKQIQIGGVKELNLIIKGDVHGTVEALSDSLQKLSRDEVRVSILHKGVGSISESDVMLAVASGAVIIGFGVTPTSPARRLSDQEAVDIRVYNIIYDCINEIKLALEGLLTPEMKEDVTSTVEIRKVFKISKFGVIAGCYVLNGKIIRNDKVRVLRDGLPIFTGGLRSLKRSKDDVREVESGYECGVALDGFNDIEVGDIIEGYKVVEIKRTFA